MADWRVIRERAPSWGIAILVTLALAFGREVPRLLLRPIVLWYWLTSRAARRASAEYRTRLGVGGGAGSSYRHLLTFAECALDRLFFLRGRLEPFAIELTDTVAYERLTASGRGALILGAHLGSFEALRLLSTQGGAKLNVVGWFHGTARVNGALFGKQRADVGTLIDAADGPVVVGLRVREAIERGELVAMLADRPGFGGAVPVTFLGATARLPSGPYGLAAALRCPVYLAFALYDPPNRYRVYCEQLAEEVVIDRRNREAQLGAWAQRYADRLEHYCRLAPLAWFNFFDYWETDVAP